MKVLFLDDRQERIDVAIERYKNDELTVVRTAEEAISELSKEQAYDLVCLDHDLGGEEFVNSNRDDCGMEIVRWLFNYQKSVSLYVARKILIHTSNLNAALEMYSKLKLRLHHVYYERFRYD